MALFTVKTAEIALVAATAKTLLELTAASGHQLEITEWWIDFDGVNPAAEPVVVEVLRKTATITGASSPPSPVKLDAADGAATASAKHNASAEGTDGDVLYRHEVPPTLGKHVIFPLGMEPVVATSGIIAIKATAPAGVNAIAGFGYRE